MTPAERQAVVRLARYVETRKEIVERIEIKNHRCSELQSELASLNARKTSLDVQADADLALLKSL